MYPGGFEPRVGLREYAIPLDQTHVPGMVVVGRVPECDSRRVWGSRVRPQARGSHVLERFRAENL